MDYHRPRASTKLNYILQPVPPSQLYSKATPQPLIQPPVELNSSVARTASDPSLVKCFRPPVNGQTVASNAGSSLERDGGDIGSLAIKTDDLNGLDVAMSSARLDENDRPGSAVEMLSAKVKILFTLIQKWKLWNWRSQCFWLNISLAFWWQSYSSNFIVCTDITCQQTWVQNVLMWLNVVAGCSRSLTKDV